MLANTVADWVGSGFWPLAMAGAFLCGSIPFGLLVGRAKGVDIRKAGSGNIGATNVGRVLGRRYFYLCFVLDFLKGVAPTIGAGLAAGMAGSADVTAVDSWGWLGTMVAVVAGHIFPPWLGFKGGKGVATSLGALLGLYPHLTLPGLAIFLVFLVTLAISRYVSLASIAASVSLPMMSAIYWIVRGPAGGDGVSSVAESLRAGAPFLVVSVALSTLVLWRHRANMTRLRNGTEPKVGQKAP